LRDSACCFPGDDQTLQPLGVDVERHYARLIAEDTRRYGFLIDYRPQLVGRVRREAFEAVLENVARPIGEHHDEYRLGRTICGQVGYLCGRIGQGGRHS